MIRFRVSVDGSDSSRLPLAVAPAVFKAALTKFTISHSRPRSVRRRTCGCGHDSRSPDATGAFTRPYSSFRGAFFFGADTLEVLDSAASHLRDQEEEILEDQTIYGFVTKCERGAVANSGLIVVEGWVEGEPPTRVSCQVQLAGEEYAAAARAHAERKLVALVGTTHRVGRRWTVDQVDSFSTETDIEGNGTPTA